MIAATHMLTIFFRLIISPFTIKQRYFVPKYILNRFSDALYVSPLIYW